ncbi:MAG: TGS domain-containing protein [candidate division WOR-3 bacterium]
MPANLTPQYLAAEKRYREAKTPEEKLVCLQEMYALIPKHKGTEKLQADIKSRISKLLKAKDRKSQTRRAVWYHFEKQGAGQVAIFGAVNVGKSSIVKILTNTPTEVAPYPFTTKIPIAGMLLYEDIQIQLIDTPPMTEDSPPWLFHIIRTADSSVWVIDVSADDLVENTEVCIKRLAQANLFFSSDEKQNLTLPDISALLPTERLIVVANKIDEPNSRFGLEILKELLGDVPIISVSVKNKTGLEELKRQIFASLQIIRIYTKPQGKKPDLTEPVILKKGSTVLDAAKALHKEFAEKLRYARLWDNDKFNGQMVEKNYVLKDKDIIEFHI